MAAGASTAHVAAVIQAIKASGAIVRVSPEEFEKLLARATGAVVVHATAWVFGTKHRYLTGYKGLFFCTDSRDPIFIPSHIETMEAQKIWIPG